jgi:hypothetical protein
MHTLRDLPMCLWHTNVVIPTGTIVRPVKDGRGETHYAVSNPGLLAALTGNTHDPRYYLVFVPADAVSAQIPRPALRGLRRDRTRPPHAHARPELGT